MILSPSLQTMPPLQDQILSKAAVIESPGRVVVKEFPLPRPGKDEVRIKVEGCGVCASDLPLWEGRDWFEYPVAPGKPGHEAWGIIDAVGEDVTNFTRGERVAGLSYNGYATHDLAKADDLIVLPDFFDNKPFPGEPLGCALNIFNRSDIQEGQTVAIVGCGFLGLLLIQLAKNAGAKVIAISRRTFSLSSAEDSGADHSIVLEDHYQIIEKVSKITKGRLCERVIEATGKEWPLNLSIEITGERGKLIVAGFHQDGMRSLNVQMLNWRGIDMISAHERDPQQYLQGIRHTIDAIEKQQMDPFPLFTHGFALEEMDKAFEHLRERPEGFIKALIINN